MERLVLWCVVIVTAGCAPTGTPELFLTASPNHIRATGVTSEIKVTGTDAKGEVGQGTVKLTSSAGSLVDGVEVQFDGFGTASAEVACDGALDGNCAEGSFKVLGTWLGVNAEVRVNIDPPPPSTESSCADGIDNDEDGLLDCLDDDCDTLSCEDGLLCTVGETCTARACGGGQPRSCVSPLHPLCASGAGTCDPAVGCVYPPQNTGISCTDGSVCTENDRCDLNGRCTGTRITCNRPPNSCYHQQGTCSSTTGCTYSKQRDGTSCGGTGASRCCSGACKDISNDDRNCGSCGTTCKVSSFCRDAAEPAGCGPAYDVSGRCTCGTDGDCPAGFDCITGRCSPRTCRAFQTREQASDGCPAYCIY